MDDGVVVVVVPFEWTFVKTSFLGGGESFGVEGLFERTCRLGGESGWRGWIRRRVSGCVRGSRCGSWSVVAVAAVVVVESSVGEKETRIKLKI